ncbi:MAG: UDP-N-acetylmuramoyl-tripeptide--D-alanyl-D-alanine ligase [Actinomycetales bacterium]
MIPLTLHELATAVGGRLVPAEGVEESLLVDGPAVTDSRQCGPGGLYVARVGEHADGHAYVPAAARAGAVLAVVSRELSADELAGARISQLVVDDTEVAFGLVARAVIEAAGHDLTVVAVTGSSGKTSTKDLLAHLLAQHGPTIAAQESFNSEIGVPLTVCRITRDTRYLVAEMGARGVGHLRYLTTIAPPDIAVVLNVGYAHASEFGSLDAVQAAKSELVAALDEGGLAVLNADDDRVAAMAPLAWAEGADIAWVSAVGRAQDPPPPAVPVEPADDEDIPMSERVDVDDVEPRPGEHVWAEAVTLDDAGRATFTLHCDCPTQGAHSAPVSLQLIGAHHVGNSLCAAAVGLRVGMALTEIADALSSAVPASRWRMEVVRRDDGVTIVNDAYNANPDSMSAALRALAAMAPGFGGRRVAVLGAMLELGPESSELHALVGKLAVALGIDRVVVVGEGARALAEAAGERATWVPSTQDARRLLGTELHTGDIALFKSSRDSGLRWLGEEVAAGQAEAPLDVDLGAGPPAPGPATGSSSAETGPEGVQ